MDHSGDVLQVAGKIPAVRREPSQRVPRAGIPVAGAFVVIVVAAGLVVALALLPGGPKVGGAPSADPPSTTTTGASLTPLEARIVSIAQGQVGYHSNPANTYCNKFSAYWVSGQDDCGNSNLDEEWCADFAAWVWAKAGVSVDYQYINGDLNSSAASFYEWGMAHDTWHPVGSGYLPQPGDVAVYGLDVPDLVAQHVAVVISYTPGDKGPNAVNGDGDHTGFSVVETGEDQVVADIPHGSAARLSGYVSPLVP